MTTQTRRSGRPSASRARLNVTRDGDGGLTIHDPASDLVVSIITTHPLANGPRGMSIEVYDYNGRDVLAEDAMQVFDAKGRLQSLRQAFLHHPTTTYYPLDDKT